MSINPVSDTYARRAEDWRRLRYLVELAAGHGIKRLSDDELWELPSLYRKTLSDLSLLRGSGENPAVVQELTMLCNKAHAVIYRRTAQRERINPWRFVAHELPRTFRRRFKYIQAASLVMLGFAVLGLLHGVLQPELASQILNIMQPEMVEDWQDSLRHAEQMDELRLAAQIPEEQRPFAAFQITANNIMVSIRAFVIGILGGFLTLALLALNGYLLGVVGFIYFTTPTQLSISLPLYFVSGIAPHGSIELPAICIAGAAGMMLGFSWMFPGQQTRGEAIRKAGRDAGRLVMIVIITLLFAGAIEGFITPLYPPHWMSWEQLFWLKIIFGSLVFACWIIWLTQGGRHAKAPTAQHGVEGS